jgi:hypothetical protein
MVWLKTEPYGAELSRHPPNGVFPLSHWFDASARQSGNVAKGDLSNHARSRTLLPLTSSTHQPSTFTEPPVNKLPTAVRTYSSTVMLQDSWHRTLIAKARFRNRFFVW